MAAKAAKAARVGVAVETLGRGGRGEAAEAALAAGQGSAGNNLSIMLIVKGRRLCRLPDIQSGCPEEARSMKWQNLMLSNKGQNTVGAVDVTHTPQLLNTHAGAFA